jgi:hypothetical protein
MLIALVVQRVFCKGLGFSKRERWKRTFGSYETGDESQYPVDFELVLVVRKMLADELLDANDVQSLSGDYLLDYREQVSFNITVGKNDPGQ